MKSCNPNLKSEIQQGCKIVLELHILNDAYAEMKVKKLAIVVHDAKYEIKSFFEFQTKISEL